MCVSFIESAEESDLKKILNDMDSKLSSLIATKVLEEKRNTLSIEGELSLQYKTFRENGYGDNSISLMSATECFLFR
jgi:hypothetical protein